MTQYNLPTINPAADTGTDLSNYLNSWEPALLSAHRGNSRPTYAVPGTVWIDSTGTPNSEIVKLYDGTQDQELFALNVTSNKTTLVADIIDGGSY